MSSKPHTKRWFARLAKLNPWQAALTLQLVTLRVTANICSFCGAKPKGDFVLLKMARKGKQAPAFRLCPDCLEMRRHSFQEEPLPTPA